MLTQSQIEELNTLLVGLEREEKEDYLLAREIDNLRVCDACGKLMEEGLVIHDGEYHICSEECLHAAVEQGLMDESIYEELSHAEDDDVGSYWTVWNE